MVFHWEECRRRIPEFPYVTLCSCDDDICHKFSRLNSAVVGTRAGTINAPSLCALNGGTPSTHQWTID